MRSIGLYSFITCFALGIVLACVTPILWEYIALSALIAFICLLSARYSRNAYIISLAFCAVSLALARMLIIPQQFPETFTAYVDSKVSLTGTVVALPDIRESNARLTVLIHKNDTSKNATTKILVVAPLYPEVHVGDNLQISGVFKKPKPFETDGGRTFDYVHFLQKDGIFAIIQPAQIHILELSSNPWLRFMRVLEYGKDYFIKGLSQALPEPENALAAGIVIGGKQGLGKELLNAFTVSGLLPIVVLSGYNVMIVVNGIMSAFSFLSKRTASVFASLTIMCFILAAGAGSSALRSGVMAFFAIAAKGTGKNYAVMRILAISFFLMLVYNPLYLLYDPGFQFSYLATMGLILGSPYVFTKLSFVRYFALQESLATTIAAQLGVLPLLLWETGNLSLISVLANILVLPVIPFAMMASTIASLLSYPLEYVSSMAPVVAGLAAYIPLTYVVRVAELLASLPLASFIIPSFHFYIVFIIYLFFSYILIRSHKQRPTAIAVGLKTP